MKSSRPPELANFFDVFKLSLQSIGNANILGAKSCLCSYYPEPLKRNGLLFCGENETTLAPFKATSREGDQKASRNSTSTESDGCRQSNCSILAGQAFESNTPFTSVDPITSPLTTNLTPSKTSLPLIIGLGVSIPLLFIFAMLLLHFSKIMKSVKDRKHEEQTYAMKKQNATINNQLSKCEEMSQTECKTLRNKVKPLPLNNKIEEQHVVAENRGRMKEWIKMRPNNRVCPVINDNLVDEKNQHFSEVFTISEKS